MNIKVLLSAVALGGLAVACYALPTHKEGELLFKLKANKNSTPLALASAGVQELERYPQVGWVRVKLLNPSQSLNSAITSVKRLPFVDKAEKNIYYYPHYTPNDSMLGQQWLVANISLAEAWDIDQGSDSVVIAVIDTGNQVNHPDMVNKFTSTSRDVVDNDNDPTDEGGVGHGTHVAGIAAAATDNGLGIAGVGFNCKIMGIRAGDFGFSAADLVEANTWAADNGANVINMSLGGGGQSQAIKDAVTYALSRNVFVCASAGNHGTTSKSYPAAYPGVMAVASNAPDDSRSGFSAYGNWVHVTAPGQSILSTVLGGGYESWDGTSMSCPVVAGLAGLVWSKGGQSMANTDVFNTITSTCDPVPGNYTIFGRVNAFQALQDTLVTVTNELEPVAVELYEGTDGQGDITDLISPDGLAYTLKTTPVARFGSKGGILATYVVPEAPEAITEMRMFARMNSQFNSTGMLWIYNNLTSNYDFIKAWPVKTGYTDVNLILSIDPTKYVAAGGEVKAIFRAHVPARRPGSTTAFTVRFDLAKMQESHVVEP